MKKTIILMAIVSMFLVSVAVAGDKGENKVGNLFLFQKCDPSLAPAADAENPKYDASGCPLPGNGPWPIFPDNRRFGQMKYNLLGDNFEFSFEGKKLVPSSDYTLIYYPDAWPGSGLICLGSSATNPAGNIQINGKMDITTGLPAPYDKNFNPVEPSGATGAKVWLVLSADVKCEGSGDVDEETGLQADPAQMLAWNPASYLFEGNLIVYQHAATEAEDAGDDETEPPDADSGNGQNDKTDEGTPSTPGNGKNGNNGKGKNK